MTDWIVALVILGISAVAVRLLTDNLIQSLARARWELAERKQAEAALLREKQFSDGILNGLPGIFFMYDDQATLVRWNKRHEQVTGYSAKELARMHATDFFGGPDQELIASQMRQAFAEGEVDMDVAVVTKTGARIPFHFIGLRTLLDGKAYLLGFGIDITERKLAAAERERLIAGLKAKNTELEQFTYTVSHDLRSPLITVRGFLTFLENDVASGNTGRIKSDMGRIMEATDKMQRLLNELLELSRVGRMMNPPQAAPFEAIAREAVGLVRGRIEARGVRVEIAPDLPTIYGDRARLVEVVQNLVDNGCKFMGDQPEPRIEIGMCGAQADADGKPILFVRDNGIGIDPQYHERVFGLFNKLDATSEGTGVGLALVLRIIVVHGGRIWVESEGDGKGATFCFTLPVPEADRPIDSVQQGV